MYRNNASVSKSSFIHETLELERLNEEIAAQKKIYLKFHLFRQYAVKDLPLKIKKKYEV